MSKARVKTARCGRYRLIVQKDESLWELDDGALELCAEYPYLVKLDDDAPAEVLRDALSIPEGGREGILRFKNFVGIAELDGRRLDVRSIRLDPSAVTGMLNEVAGRLASLPFGAGAPTGSHYERVQDIGLDALYHAFAFLRDCVLGLSPLNLLEAVERILAHPHESLLPDDPRLTPLSAVSRVDAETMLAIQSEPELLAPVARSSSLASLPLTQRLRGALPENVRVRPTRHSVDTPENRFVAGALDMMIELLQRFERLVLDEDLSSAAINSSEAREFGDALRRLRRHPVLDKLAPSRQVPLQSTVLRARAGYRDLLHIYSDLLGRTELGKPHGTQALLELRDAADIYELWCYFQVVAALEEILGAPQHRDRFMVNTLKTGVGWGYATEWKGATKIAAIYNKTFSPSKDGSPAGGFSSYSVGLRPDITLRTRDGGTHLLDAKLKLAFKEAAESNDEDQPAQGDSFKNADLHKMHAYRDALGADSVWVLYPGHDEEPTKYETPENTSTTSFRGVGAVPLRPGAGHDGGLQTLLEALLESN